jgi:hypothetical protein
MMEDRRDEGDSAFPTVPTVPTLHTGASGPSLGGTAIEAPADSDFAEDANTSDDPTMARRQNGNGTSDDETRPLSLPPVSLDLDKIGDKRLVQLAIDAAPDPLFEGRHLPATRFAADIALCNDRTIRRYQEGSRSLNIHLREKLLGRVKRAQKLADDPRMADPVAAWKAIQRLEAKREP